MKMENVSVMEALTTYRMNIAAKVVTLAAKHALQTARTAMTDALSVRMGIFSCQTPPSVSRSVPVGTRQMKKLTNATEQEVRFCVRRLIHESKAMIIMA